MKKKDTVICLQSTGSMVVTKDTYGNLILTFTEQVVFEKGERITIQLPKLEGKRR